MSDVQLGLCVGGLLRTWDTEGTRLWIVEDDALLTAVQGTGVLARTGRGENRFREVADLDLADAAAPRLRLAGDVEIALRPAEGQVTPRPEAPQEFVRAINQAVRHAAETFEYLVVEIGGPDAPLEPYAFFALHVDEDGAQLSTVEVAPPPAGSELWAPHLAEGEGVVSLSAPVSAEALDMAPYYLADAVPGWGLLPWDVALTYGARPA